MPARRRRRPGSDRLYVTTDDGLPLGHVDLVTGATHDVPAAWRDRFLREANAWLWQNNLPPLPGGDEERPTPVLEAGVEAPEGGWDAGWEDVALHRPGHLLADEAARARTSGVPDADRPSRLRADGQHAVDDALAKLTRPRLRRGRSPRWRILHAVDMTFAEAGRGGLTAADVRRGGAAPAAGGTPSTVLLDHVVIGPPGVFVVEVQNHPGGRAYIGPESLEIDGAKIDLGRRRRIGEEAARRLSTGLAAAAGAAETLNPPIVTPVVAVVGAIVVGLERPRGVLVSRVGHLPRLLQAFGPQLVDEAVGQVHAVARRSDTWS